MRQIVVTFVVLAALAAPAAAFGQHTATGDGSLVVKNGEAPALVPVVALRITGSVIGHIGYGRIVIDAGASSDAVPQVLGAGRPGDWPKTDTAQVWPATGKALDISFNDFIRTTQTRHRVGVTDLAKRIYDNGDIYEGVYEGWYCVGCEAFKQEKDLIDGGCPLMFSPTADPAHRAMRYLCTLTGKVPTHVCDAASPVSTGGGARE